MDRIKATMLLAEIKGYLTAGNPVWDVDEIAEACDMAIEALRNEINCVKCVHYTERETYTGIKGVCKMDTAHREDLIRRQLAIDMVFSHRYEYENKLLNDYEQGWNDACDYAADEWLESLPSAEAEDRLYIKIYADDEPSVMAEKLYQICGETQNGEVAKWLKEYSPSAEPKTGWIPVSEELPSEGQVVLAIGDKGTWDVGKFQGTAGWTCDERMWDWKKKSVKLVEYWMPKDAIPLPNREDGEEE